MSTAAIIAFLHANSYNLSVIGLGISEILGSTTFVKSNSITTLLLGGLVDYLKVKANRNK